MSKINDIQAQEIIDRYVAGEGSEVLCVKYGLDRSSVMHIIRGAYRKHLNRPGNLLEIIKEHKYRDRVYKEISKPSFVAVKSFYKDHTIAETAEYFHVTYNAMTYILRIYNLYSENTKQRLAAPFSLTTTQQDTLIGNLLGDGHLTKIIPKKAKESCFSIGQCLRRAEYVKALHEIYLPFSRECYTSRDKKPTGVINGKVSYNNWVGEYCYRLHLRTCAHPVFTHYRNVWYPGGKKIIPIDIELNWRVAAFWACDDGSNAMSEPNSDHRRFVLCTHGFSVTEVELLVDRLNRDLGIVGTLRLSRKRPFISIDGDAAVAFVDGIKSFIPFQCLQYKLITKVKG